jgi:23S rRNA pseudouridine1911/1915/1917 synthase
LKEPFSSSEFIKVNNDYSQVKHKVFISDEGKASHTDFVPLEYDKSIDATLVACYPHTGRTHQIRVHLFHVKHPILGDPLYGSTYQTADDYLEGVLSHEDRMMATGASRLMLHAQSLTFSLNSKFHIESRSNFSGMRHLICKKEKRFFNKKEDI